MPSAIDMVYEKLNQLFGGSKTQVFCMEFPGRVLNEGLYAYDATSKYSMVSKPQPVVEEEFRLSDGLLDLQQITGGTNGERLSAVYEQALNMLIPKFYNIPQFDKDKAKMRDWLLGLVDDVDEKTGPCKKTRVQLYEDLSAKYLKEKLDWQTEKNGAWEKAVSAQDKDRAMEEYARWVAREAPIRDARVQTLYNDLVIRGYYHEIGNILGYLDVALESELIEKGKQGMRNSSMSSLDESEDIYPVYFEPNDWFKGLSTDFTPMDLLVDPEFLTARLMTKQKELESLQVEYGRLQASRTGDVEALKKSVAEKEAVYDKAENDMLNNFSSTVVQIAKIFFAHFGDNPVKGAFNDELKKGGNKGLSDEEWNQLVTMQKNAIQAQQDLSKAARLLAEAQAELAGAEATELKTTLATMKAKIDSLRAEVDQITEILNSDVGRNDVYVFIPRKAKIDQLVTDKKLTQEQADRLSGEKTFLDQQFDSIEEAKAKAKGIQGVGDLPDDVILAMLDKSRKSTSLVPSSDSPVGQFQDIILSVEAGQTSSTTSLQTGASFDRTRVSFLIGSVSSSQSSSFANFSSKYQSHKSSFQIGFRAMKVNINRGGWFNPQVLKATKAMVRLTEKKISVGPPSGQWEEVNKYLLPAFPVAFVLAKDVTIKLKLEDQDISTVSSVMNSNSEACGGFLCFSTGHSRSSSSNTQSFFCGTSGTDLMIRIPGPQILGWFLECVNADEADATYTPMPEDYLPKPSK